MNTSPSSCAFITTPIFYVNARPHLGSAYGVILADFLYKYEKMHSKDSFFLTGSDEHGEKIANKASEQGQSPQEFVDEIVAAYKETWSTLGILPDRFYRTTDSDHKALVQCVLQRLKDKDEIYFSEYEGRYCVGCERFRTDAEWTEEGKCPDHLTPGETRKEPNYFFRMSKYQERLIEHYEKNPEAIQPAQYRKEVLSMLKEPLDDLNISRPKTRLSWGIEIPFDTKYVTYVWFDALLNYLGGIGYDGNEQAPDSFRKDYWEQSTHTLGKDILKTHAIYWPTMLMALGLSPAKRLLVNGFWQVEGQKMSKSLGNVVDPLEIEKQYGVDEFRYFLLSEMSFGSDANFSIEAFINRCNAELANGLGNLSSRVLTLVKKNFDFKAPPRASLKDEDTELLNSLKSCSDEMQQSFQGVAFHKGVKSFAECVAACDRYINLTKPWALAKEEAQRERLGTVLSVALEALSALSVFAFPLIPKASLQLRDALGLDRADPLWEQWKTMLEEGHKLTALPRLFPRIEKKK